MSHRLQVLIPEDLDARIGKAAQRARVSKGEWVRRAVEAALREKKERGRPSDPLARMASLAAPTGDIDQMLAEIDAGRR
jgi:metal-responsive CopG/Arc/MetJ family transcriptional regulator